MSNTVSSRMEDYLEVILRIQKKNSVARVTEIADMLDVSKPTVTSALKKLGNEDLVDHETYGYIKLTEEGQKAAEDVQERHLLLRHFFLNILGVDEDTAAEDACQTEHSISETTLDRLTLFIQFIAECPRTGNEWLNHFECYCATNSDKTPERCSNACITRCIREIQEKKDQACHVSGSSSN